jgi:hypothetical protein
VSEALIQRGEKQAMKLAEEKEAFEVRRIQKVSKRNEAKEMMSRTGEDFWLIASGSETWKPYCASSQGWLFGAWPQHEPLQAAGKAALVAALRPLVLAARSDNRAVVVRLPPVIVPVALPLVQSQMSDEDEHEEDHCSSESEGAPQHDPGHEEDSMCD